MLKFWPPSAEKREKASDSETKRRRGVAKATCPFSGFESLMAMRDEVLVKVRDVEQLLQHGRETHACPYYSTRMAIPAAQVHTHLMQHTLAQIQPCAYSLSLSFSGGGVAVSVAAPCFHPQASGIKLKDQIVIIDEAHNLTDTISAIHSTEISGAQVHGHTYSLIRSSVVRLVLNWCVFLIFQLCRAHSQLSQYCERYRYKYNTLLYISFRVKFIYSPSCCSKPIWLFLLWNTKTECSHNENESIWCCQKCSKLSLLCYQSCIYLF